jgi:hypothetical protein
MLAVAAAPAYAQAAANPPIRRAEVEFGGGILGGAALGSADANLRANAATKQPYRLFSTDTRLGPAPSLLVRAAFAWSRRFAVEGGLVVSQPKLRTSVSADVENAPSLTVDERIDQYFLEGGVVVRLDEIRFSPRTVPFVAGGVGYLRQLHEGLTLVEEGHLYHLGGGVKHWLRTNSNGFIRSAGVRADARVYLLMSGLSFDDGSRAHVAATGSFFVVF